MANLMAILVVALALVGPAMGSPEEYDKLHLANYCRILDLYMSKRLKGGEDSVALAKMAIDAIQMPGGLIDVDRSLAHSVASLADAWRDIAFKEPCSSKSLAYVSLIHDCQPGTSRGPRPTQVNLYDDTKAYAQKCLTPQFLSAQLAKARRGALGNSDPSGLESFLTGAVLAAYRRANPDEDPLDLAIRAKGDNCCRAGRAKGAIKDQIAASFAKQVARMRAKPEGMREGMTKLLASHLFAPCASYVARMRPLMKGAEAGEFFIPYEQPGFLASLSQEFHDAAFRYKFCLNLEFEDSKNRLVDMMLSNF